MENKMSWSQSTIGTYNECIVSLEEQKDPFSCTYSDPADEPENIKKARTEHNSFYDRIKAKVLAELRIFNELNPEQEIIAVSFSGSTSYDYDSGLLIGTQCSYSVNKPYTAR